jgi:hypothetical protein
VGDYWLWVPCKSIGPFVFGDVIDHYVADFELRKRERENPIYGWDTYELPGFESWVIVENGQIAEVHCVDELVFGDADLIGMAVEEIRGLIGKESEKEDDVGLGYAMYYYDMGLTLFIENDAVRAAACGPKFDSADYPWAESPT